MHICVIGSGVVGTATAFLLASDGYKVTLLDSQPEPAMMTSRANGGQLSYNYVAPLAGPGVWPDLPGWLLDRNSPLRFRPRFDPHQWKWLTAFLKACNASRSAQTTAEMLTLSFLSRDTLHAWMQKHPIDFEWRQNGKLIMHRDQGSLESARRQMEKQLELGSEQRIVLRDELLEIEPSLRSIGHLVVGAVFTPGEEVGDCQKFTQGLFDKLQAMGNANCLMKHHVRSLGAEQGRIRSAITSAGDIEADAFIVANGMGSRELLKPLGYTPAIYGLKGYSLSIPLDNEQQSRSSPEISVTDYQRRIVYARMGNQLRAAAMVDIGDETTVIRDDRIQALKRQISDTFPGLNISNSQPWAGLRPATPTSKPIIGQAPVASNLWLNIGHGPLGFTLACGSAVLLKALIEGIACPIDPDPFRP